MTGFVLTPILSMETPRYTRAEQEIYNALVKAKPDPLSTDDIGAILDTVRKDGQTSSYSNSGNLAAVHIRNLRNKIPKAQAIETVRGVGYKLVLV